MKNMSNVRSGYGISELEKVCLQCCGFRTLKLCPLSECVPQGLWQYGDVGGDRKKYYYCYQVLY